MFAWELFRTIDPRIPEHQSRSTVARDGPSKAIASDLESCSGVWFLTGDRWTGFDARLMKRSEAPGIGSWDYGRRKQVCMKRVIVNKGENKGCEVWQLSLKAEDKMYTDYESPEAEDLELDMDLS